MRGFAGIFFVPFTECPPFVDVLGEEEEEENKVRPSSFFFGGVGNIRRCFDFIYVFGAVVQHKLVV